MMKNNIVKKIIRFCLNKDYRFLILVNRGFYAYLDDKKYLERMFRVQLGKNLNFENPVTFNEKIQWLKINNRESEYTIMVDKYKVREYISETIGEQYLIPLLGVWDSPDEINFDILPDEFVLKCNHNSGLGMCICKNKSTLNIEKVKQDLSNGLNENYYLLYREWPYKNVEKKIIAEKYMSDQGKELQDYKIHCFNGIPKIILVCRDRFSDTGLTEDFFDIEWNHLNISRENCKHSVDKIKAPKNLKLMLRLARILSENIPFVRIDFYEINGKVYFGEITFFPASGLKKFIPEKWDIDLGNEIQLNKK